VQIGNGHVRASQWWKARVPLEERYQPPSASWSKHQPRPLRTSNSSTRPCLAEARRARPREERRRTETPSDSREANEEGGPSEAGAPQERPSASRTSTEERPAREEGSRSTGQAPPSPRTEKAAGDLEGQGPNESLEAALPTPAELQAALAARNEAEERALLQGVYESWKEAEEGGRKPSRATETTRRPQQCS